MYKLIGGDQKEYGPAHADEVRQWIHEGRLTGTSLGRPDSSDEWKPLAGFPEFSEALSQQAERYPTAAAALAGLNRPPEPVRMPILEPRVQVGSCLARSAQFLGANFGLVAGASGLVLLLGLITQFTPFVGGILYMFLEGVLYGGLYYVVLRRIRGYQDVTVREVLVGFGPAFGQLMLAGFVSSFISWLGFLFCVAPWVYLVVAWTFCVPLVADKRLEFWSAMELSRRVVTRVWPQVALLLVLAFLPVVLTFLYTQVKIFSVAYPGFQAMMSSGTPDVNKFMQLLNEMAKVGVPLEMLNKIVLLFNLPYAVGALMYAYEDLFGKREAPNA
jgi:hypothetical protein